MPRPFTDILGDLGGGATLDQLTEHLAAVVSAVQETGRSGSLTLTLKIQKNGDYSVIITDDIKVKAPEPARAQALFFTDQGGTLHRKDPRQPDLPLRTVEPTRPMQA